MELDTDAGRQLLSLLLLLLFVNREHCSSSDRRFFRLFLIICRHFLTLSKKSSELIEL